MEQKVKKLSEKLLLKIKFKKEWKKKIYLDENEIKEEDLRKLNKDFKKMETFIGI